MKPMTITKGCTFREIWQIRQEPGETLDGYAVRAEVRATAGGPVVVDLAPTISDPAECLIEIFLTAEATSELPSGTCWTDVLLVLPSGETEVLAKGLRVEIHETFTDA